MRLLIQKCLMIMAAIVATTCLGKEMLPTVKTLPAPKSSLTIVNNINKQATGYKKFFKQFFPNEFAVKINGKPLKYGEKLNISPDNKTICVEYSYVWDVPLWGRTEGKKEEHCVIPPQSKELAVNFAGWDAKKRIVVE